MKKTLLGDLISVGRRFAARFGLSFAAVLISNLLLIFNPLLFRQAILAVENNAQTLDVLKWAFLLLSISLVSACFKYWMRMGFIDISREVEREVRSNLFARIQNQSRVFFDKHGVGELLSRVTNDISVYREVLGPGIMFPAYFSTLVIPALGALFYLSPQLASLSLVPLICIPLLNVFVRKTLFQTSYEVQNALGNMSNIAHEYFSGIRIVKSYDIEQATLLRFKNICRHFVKLNMHFICIQGVVFPLLTLITKIITVLLVLLAGAIVMLGFSMLNTADFISFMWIQSYIFFPVLMLGWILPIYERGRAAYARLVEIYEESIDVQGNKGSQLKIPPQADIIFRHFSFKYPSAEHNALSDITTTIKGGTFVGITGPVGAGKTTLFRILSREYAIGDGMIAIGGHDINDYDLESFFQEMVTVEQVPFLFSKTIAENILFGRQQATQKELESVIHLADLHETILEFPEKYETIVGERGLSLSGGQKQRVAMARAFLVNRSILLLDDIFSAVDFATERRIFNAMKKNLAGKTILLVTHRVSILQELDRVICLSEGRITEDGSPKELAACGGYYSALVELQQRHGPGGRLSG